MIGITNIRHAWPERSGFVIDRPAGTEDFVFLHFWNPVELLVQGKVTVTRPSACILYRPGTPQWFLSRSDLIHDWMHLTGDVLQACSAFSLSCDTVYYPKNDQPVREGVQRLEMEHFSNRLFCADLCDLYIRVLLAELSRQVKQGTVPERLTADTQERLKELRFSLLTEYARPWKVEDMAATVSFSPSRLHALYREMFGISPMRDLILIRIERAKDLLSRTEQPVSAIASAVGYTSSYHFIRQFRAVAGVSPGRFRSQG